jgi:anti-anti-sigma factor
MLIVMSENRGNAAVLRCSGRIVAGEEAWTLYKTVTSEQGKRVVVLDLTAVSGVDAGGLGVLASLGQWARVAGVRLQLIPSKAVHEMLDLTGLGSVLEVCPSENAQPAPILPAGPWEDSAIRVAADD